MIKKLTIPVDHGNRNMKTTHFLFTTGLSSTDRKPAGREDFLQTDGKYYVLSGKRIPYQRDKTQDERFSILTRFAIAKELERTGQVSEEDVVQVSLPIGVPPKHYAELAEWYREYFLGDGKVQELVYNGRTYHTCIQDVAVYPQAYAAMMTEGEKIRQIPKAVGIDIGGFTSDFLLMRSEAHAWTTVIPWKRVSSPCITTSFPVSTGITICCWRKPTLTVSWKERRNTIRKWWYIRWRKWPGIL